MSRIRLLIRTAMLTLVASASGAWAGTESTVTVMNQSLWEIHHFFLSPVDKATWGPDQLGEKVIQVDGRFDLVKVPCDTFDIKLVNDANQEAVVPKVDICKQNQVWTVTTVMLPPQKGCRLSKGRKPRPKAQCVSAIRARAQGLIRINSVVQAVIGDIAIWAGKPGASPELHAIGRQWSELVVIMTEFETYCESGTIEEARMETLIDSFWAEFRKFDAAVDTLQTMSGLAAEVAGLIEELDNACDELDDLCAQLDDISDELDGTCGDDIDLLEDDEDDDDVAEHDTDGDGTPDITDTDDDNDGIPDDKDDDDNNDGIDDMADLGGDDDFDDDGIPDAADDDDDNDGTPDAEDTDDDNDGVPDADDTDDDNDGVADDDEVAEDSDFDNDGIVDSADPDDDNDGTPDTEDTDDDNDGVPDEEDADDDNDGIADAEEDGPGDEDFDNDGVADAEDEDDDNDGTPDAEDTDDDNDGTPDDVDTDDDNDGVADSDEGGDEGGDEGEG